VNEHVTFLPQMVGLGFIASVIFELLLN